ncbi:MAG: type II toxin-antitoxin system VapC family toxin [Treponema sp.]|jgi:predicted nucleic acid-binding protein|nr:type II toxin-antitoxin system VapC family toxin [Treponema sp.]
MGRLILKLLLDTNVIIDFLKQKDAACDLTSLLLQHECFVSVIVKLELLKYPEITPVEENAIIEFLRLVPIMPLNDTIENQTIALSRATKLKLPDAIIGATSIVYDAEVVTCDPHFLKCQYKNLRIWKRAI